MMRLGDQLVQHGLVDPLDLEAALERQAVQGGYLGQHLVDGGFVTRQQLYDGLAAQWDLERRDLDQHPPDRALLRHIDLERAVELGWVPCETTLDGQVVVATTVRPGPDLLDEVHDQFPAMPVRFVACTRRDLDHVAVRFRRDHHDALRPRTPEAMPDRCRSLALRDLWTGLVAAGVLAATLAAPPAALAGVLVVAAAAFLLAVLAQCAGALSAAARDSRPRPDGAAPAGRSPANDVLLPTYSILVAVAGGAQVRRALGCVEDLDYPASRKDVVLLVDDSDAAALAAVRSAAPPSWVRIAAHAHALAADPVAVYDEGLALARGRYVVALSPDESPARDQLWRAVTAFETDLDENLTARRGRPPLAGLRVAHRVHGRRWSLATMLGELDGTFLLDRSFPWRGPTVDLRHELTSVHFNTRVLRRLGGWRFAVTGGAGRGQSPARMARLDSVTRVRRRPRVRSVVGERAVFVERGLRRATERAGRLLPLAAPGAPGVAEVALGFGTPVLLLSYPVGLVASVAFLVRRAEVTPFVLQLGLAGLAVVGLGLLLAMGVAGLLGLRRRGWPALVEALLLPALWLVHAAAAWYAALVLLPCHPPDPAAAPTSGLGGRLD